MVGEAPTTWLTQTVRAASRPSRFRDRQQVLQPARGFVGQFYFGPHVDLTVVTQHGEDNAWFGQGYGDFIDGVATANNTTRNHPPAGAPKPHLDGVLFEPHYGSTARNSSSSAGMKRSGCRNKPMALDPLLRLRPTFGNISTYTIGYRYNPFMTSRAGFAWHKRIQLAASGRTAQLSGSPAQHHTSELLVGFDFDF